MHDACVCMSVLCVLRLCWCFVLFFCLVTSFMFLCCYVAWFYVVPFYILGFSSSPPLRHYLSFFGGSEFYRILKSRTALVPVRDFNDPIK